MNTLLNALRPIMNTKTAKIVLEVSGHPKDDSQMVIIAKPVVGPISAKAPHELQVLCAHLATPIKVVGTPEDIEDTLTKAINEQASHRTTWANRAAEMEAQIQTAAQTDSKGKTAAKPASKPATPAATPKADDKDNEVPLTTGPDTADEKMFEPVTGGFSL